MKFAGIGQWNKKGSSRSRKLEGVQREEAALSPIDGIWDSRQYLREIKRSRKSKSSFAGGMDSIHATLVAGQWRGKG